jgi:response regulator RpfG family c-di-GMP phosphodiesterase
MPDGKKKILLVDDEALILRLTRSTLGSESFELFEADRGEKALEIARQVRPDLVLLDIKLPDIDGLQVCRAIKEDPLLKDTYVILLTGEEGDRLEEKGREAGADGFFHKPFSPMELLRKIRRTFFNEEDEDGSESGEEAARAVFHTPQHLRQMKDEQLLMYAMDLARLHQKELAKSREIKKAYGALKEMEKMKDIFIAIVSHELRTPLSIIKGYLYLLQEVLDKSSLDQDVSGFTTPITRATDRLESLIVELLDFSRMKSGLMTFEKKEVHIPDFLRLILKEYKAQFNARNIKLIVDVKDDDRPIRADHERLKEAFSHFIRNAISFTSPGGSFQVQCRDEGIWVEVKFIDSGIGITRENVDKIFSPFYQAANYMTREVEGLGLGLSIAKHIIEDHGGNISVDSIPGQGSIFTVRLPRSYQDAKEIVAELKKTYPQQIEELSKNLKATQQQLLSYAQQLSGMYAKEKQRTEQLEDTLNELEQTFVQTLAALSRMVDIKDSYSSSHTDRVSFYAVAIARKLNPELLHDRNFRYSLLLHDIGKIGIAEEILGKAGKLTDEEWHILKAHPEKSVEILREVEYLAPALNAIRSHHERWDGKGYPDALKGDEIPLSARIIAVADSFDAMTTDRPYRKGMTLEDARMEIQQQAEFQFDPEIVRSFIDAWEEIREFAGKAKAINTLESNMFRS